MWPNKISYLEILLAYRTFRQTLNASYSNDTIVRKIRQLEKEFSCTLVPSQITDILRISPENFERNMFRIIQKKTGNKAIVDIDKYAIVPKLTYKLLKKYNYCSPYTSNVSNYNRYLHFLLCTSHTGRRTFISYNVMRCATEAEVRKCSGHKSMKTFERYITFDED